MTCKSNSTGFIFPTVGLTTNLMTGRAVDIEVMFNMISIIIFVRCNDILLMYRQSVAQRYTQEQCFAQKIVPPAIDPIVKPG